MTENEEVPATHRLSGLISFAIGLAYFPAAILWGSAGPSAFGWAIIACGFLCWLGFVLGSRGKTGPAYSVVAVVVALAILGVHHVAANSTTNVYIRNSESPAPISTLHLLPEQDLAVVGARVLGLMGYFSKKGEEGPIVGPMSSTYNKMFISHFASPSPMLRSRDAVPDRKSFDILVFEPDEFKGKAVIFLHGYGGNWAMPCWMAAREANRLGFRVYCPTLDKNADWSSNVGRKIVGRVFKMLRDEKIGTVVIGGISNGAVGASILARQFSGEVDGVLLIAGAAKKSKPGGKRFIVFHGKDDKMSPILAAREFAAATDNGKIHELEGGHFAVLEHRDVFWNELGNWLAEF